VATGVYKRGKVWWIRYIGLDGKQKRESTRSDNFKNAETILADRKQAIGKGEEPEIKRIPNYSFRELSERYLPWIQGRQRSARTKGYIIGQLLSLYADMPLKRFNTAIVDQLQTDLISKGYKPASNNKITNILKHMFNKAVEWEMVGSETLKRIRKVKLLKDEGKRLRYLSIEECNSLVNACDNHLKPIVVTALNTGMRRGEILNLKWDQVDLKHGFILLDRTKNGERREIPINKTLEALFLDKNLIRRIDVPYVFYGPVTGNPYQDVKRSFNTALRKAKIRDFHFHDLRHTFASHLVMSGVDITTVSRLLGHKSLSMTLRYSHLAPSHMVKAVDVLDTVLNGKIISTKLAQFESVGR
jgi:integrase